MEIFTNVSLAAGTFSEGTSLKCFAFHQNRAAWLPTLRYSKQVLRSMPFLECDAVWLLLRTGLSGIRIACIMRLMRIVPSSPILVTLMIEAIRSSETSVLKEQDGVTSQKTAFFAETNVVSESCVF
jgi:hypothetical protein